MMIPASKLVATIHPEKPVWSAEILRHLDLKAPYPGARGRMVRILDVYDKISAWYDLFLVTPQAERLTELFDRMYPGTELTPLKKVDLVLWQMR